MKNLFYPKEYLNSVYELTPEKLKALKIKTVIFDIDNTLVPYFVKAPTKEVLEYFGALRASDISVCVLSNSRPERAREFCLGLDIPFVSRAKKPFNSGLKILSEMLSLKPEEALIVGDQIFTDVLLGNLNGIYSVLVKKVDRRDELITAVKRPLEKIVLFFYMRRRKNDG
ncbi:MAG: YqeG family HAD IIIA-type phosphatase [Clostridiales bacterium]|nr:YqeG family HAD IIIA-type phosphatase [Clostridiales bacterium]